MKTNPVRVGLIGFGTVGAGVAKILLENRDKIFARTGQDIELAAVVDLDTTTQRPVTLPDGMLTDDINTILEDNSIRVAVELIGGTTFARELQIKLLKAGKHVVTANKALLAEHGSELYTTAKASERCIAFEASCAGGIPIISAIRSGLAANNIKGLYGIVNGTCNYILSSMTAKGEDFPVALKQAQELGYAEADPTLDINGGDSAHKLTIMAMLAFGADVKMSDIYSEGIENISITDINFAKEMGYKLKLLAIAEKNDSGKISLRVHPAFVSNDNPLAQVDGPFNAVSIFGDAVGQTMYYGRGAGMMPTASAVVADIIEVAMGNSQPLFEAMTSQDFKQNAPEIDSVDNLVSRFYIKLMVTDQPGTFAKLADVLSKHDISISGILQHEGKDANTVPAIITTHPNKQSSITAAMVDMTKLEVVQSQPVCIRIVDIPEDDLED